MNLAENVYKLRQNFMILGLTGRTGSGCSTVANLLKGGFENFSPIPSTSNEGVTNDERKYRIEYNFLNTQWANKKFKFTIIKASDIIFFYALQEEFEDFSSFFFDATDKAKYENDYNSEIKRDLENKLEKVQKKFDTLHKEAIKIHKYLEESHIKKTPTGKNEDRCLAFFRQKLPTFREEVMDLSDKSIGEITRLFQKWGDNIRKYGRIIEINGREANDPSELAHTINRLIKVIRLINIANNDPTFIIIDSLRNPYEVLYFRERYSAFYLMSISTDNYKRKQNLHKQNYTESEIAALDEQEYPSHRKGINEYNSQDVEQCIELSDIHVIHDNEEIERNFILKKQLLHVVALILHPGLVQPTHEERLMQIAYTAKFNSGCLSRQVGAVVTDKNYSVKAIGWNTVAKGQTPCTLRDVCDLYRGSDESAFSSFELNHENFRKIIERNWERYNNIPSDGGDLEPPINRLKGLPLPFCFKDYYACMVSSKDRTLSRSLHAEENAFLQLSKYGSVGIEGGFLFTTASCCELCAKKAYQLGISKIYYIDIYPGISNSHIFNAGERKNEIKIVQFKGIIGRAYEALYNPFFAMKDEIEYLTGVKINYVSMQEKREY